MATSDLLTVRNQHYTNEEVPAGSKIRFSRGLSSSFDFGDANCANHKRDESDNLYHLNRFTIIHSEEVFLIAEECSINGITQSLSSRRIPYTLVARDDVEAAEISAYYWVRRKCDSYNLVSTLLKLTPVHADALAV